MSDSNVRFDEEHVPWWGEVSQEEKEIRASVSEGFLCLPVAEFLGVLESPIELKLVRGITEVMWPVFLRSNFTYWHQKNEFERLKALVRGSYFVVDAQPQIAGYRADFLIEKHELWYTQKGEKTWFVGQVLVECDGHDFHEKTKEQARRDKQRDRKLSAAGYQVLRFTGSEIHADAEKCAQEIRSFLSEQERRAKEPGTDKPWRWVQIHGLGVGNGANQNDQA